MFSDHTTPVSITVIWNESAAVCNCGYDFTACTNCTTLIVRICTVCIADRCIMFCSYLLSNVAAHKFAGVCDKPLPLSTTLGAVDTRKILKCMMPSEHWPDEVHLTNYYHTIAQVGT